MTRSLETCRALDTYSAAIAEHGITEEHLQRADGLLSGALGNLASAQLAGRDSTPQRHAVVNILAFLETFPLLLPAKGCTAYPLAGKVGPASLRCTTAAYLPGADHTYWWRVRGVRGPIVATTFPYRWDDATHAKATAFGEAIGLRLEVSPTDVPDMYYPGWTRAIVWSRASIDWRTEAGAFA